MKVERHEMKKLVLAYEQRQEEEDYSGRRGLGAESEVITQVLMGDYSLSFPSPYSSHGSSRAAQDETGQEAAVVFRVLAADTTTLPATTTAAATPAVRKADRETNRATMA